MTQLSFNMTDDDIMYAGNEYLASIGTVLGVPVAPFSSSFKFLEVTQREKHASIHFDITVYMNNEFYVRFDDYLHLKADRSLFLDDLTRHMVETVFNDEASYIHWDGANFGELIKSGVGDMEGYIDYLNRVTHVFSTIGHNIEGLWRSLLMGIGVLSRMSKDAIIPSPTMKLIFVVYEKYPQFFYEEEAGVCFKLPNGMKGGFKKVDNNAYMYALEDDPLMLRFKLYSQLTT